MSYISGARATGSGCIADQLKHEAVRSYNELIKQTKEKCRSKLQELEDEETKTQKLSGIVGRGAERG